MSFQLPAAIKRYSYAEDNPYAMSGGLATLPSTSISQPGGTVAAPRAKESALSAFTATPGQSILKGSYSALNRPPSTAGPTPQESYQSALDAYRAAGAGWEQQRGELAGGVSALTAPTSWQQYGTPEQVWKATLDKQVGDLDMEMEGRRAKVDADQQAGIINSAEARAKREALDREYYSRLAQAQSGIATSKITEARAAAGEAANRLLSLYSATPVQKEPTEPTQQTPSQAPFSMGGARGGGSGEKGDPAAAFAQKAGFTDWNGATQQQAVNARDYAAAAGDTATANRYQNAINAKWGNR